MKIICIGRNYAAHAAELGNERPSRPVVFMKPPTALLVNNKPFFYPDFSQDIHYETELVVKIAKNGRHVQPSFAHDYVEALTIGLDLTARDLQSQLKEKGHPWEIAKGFDGSAPISSEWFFPDDFTDLNNIEFGLTQNGAPVQHGETKNMLFPIGEIICYISQFFLLQKGDLIYTGTPKGVGPIARGDELVGWIGLREGRKEILTLRIK